MLLRFGRTTTRHEAGRRPPAPGSLLVPTRPATRPEPPEPSWSGDPEAPVDDALDLAGDHAAAGLERLLQETTGHRPSGLDGRRELLGALDVLPGVDQPGHPFLALLD